MSVRLVISVQARPGKGGELLGLMEERCRGVREEPGCLQYEVFQSGHDPDRLVLLELWQDQAALDVHAAVNAARPADPRLAELREGISTREDYAYNRTR